MDAPNAEKGIRVKKAIPAKVNTVTGVDACFVKTVSLVCESYE